jgi:outer membrane lipoprotein-sorting protein
MSYLRRASTQSLVILVVALCAVAAGGAAIAVAAGGGGPTPPPKPLDQAIADALGAKHPDGVTAQVQFTNRLFPSGALLGQASSALMSGASGRLWLTNDGQGRIELQSDAGDAQIVWNPQTISVYDASSNTVYRANLPASSSRSDTGTPPALADIDTFLTDIGVHWALSDAQPSNVAGQPAYTVSASPKHDGGLLGSLELAWDAANGTPLRAAIYAQGSTSPVLELTVTDISYGAVASSDVDVAPPAGAKVVVLGSGAQADTGSSTCASSAATRCLPSTGKGWAGSRSWSARPTRPPRIARSRTCRPCRSTVSPRTSSRLSSEPCSSGSRAARASCSPGRCPPPRRKRPLGP